HGRQGMGRRRGLHAGRLRGRAFAVLRGLDGAHSGVLFDTACLPRAPVGTSILCTRGGRSALLPVLLPLGSAGSGLSHRRAKVKMAQAGAITAMPASVTQDQVKKVADNSVACSVRSNRQPITKSKVASTLQRRK